MVYFFYVDVDHVFPPVGDDTYLFAKSWFFSSFFQKFFDVLLGWENRGGVVVFYTEITGVFEGWKVWSAGFMYIYVII